MMETQNAHFAYKMLALALSTSFSEKDSLHSGDDTTKYCMNEVRPWFCC